MLQRSIVLLLLLSGTSLFGSQHAYLQHPYNQIREKDKQLHRIIAKQPYWYKHMSPEKKAKYNRFRPIIAELLKPAENQKITWHDFTFFELFDKYRAKNVIVDIQAEAYKAPELRKTLPRPIAEVLDRIMNMCRPYDKIMDARKAHNHVSAVQNNQT